MTIADSSLIHDKVGVQSVSPLDMIVLAGGPGVERAVSLDSGRAVHDALLRLGHRAALCDIRPDDLSSLDQTADLVFIALHGEFGEDGCLQAELDRRGIRYCGSGPDASRLAMNKAEAKLRFEGADIPTPPYVVVTADNVEELPGRLHPPVVVKPVSVGSSVDTSIARTEEQVIRSVRHVLEIHGSALVERYIAGPELTVGVLGDRALPVCEIRTQREFYDYQAKYVDDNTEYVFDIDLAPVLLERVQRLSVQAHRVLGCRAFSRVDWMIESESGSPFALEVNTIPGFTSHSLLPKAAARVGVGFDQLCQRIVELSLSSADD